MNSKKFAIFITILFLVSANLFAGTPSFKPVSSAKVVALNGIYAAGYDGISSLTSNPAGLAYLNGRAFEGSVFGKLGQQDFIKPDGTLFRSFRDDDINFNIGAYWRLTDNVTVALDYNNTYQYHVNWPFVKRIVGDSSSATLAFDHFNEYAVTAINPSVAMNFGSFSVGVTVNIMNIKHRKGFYQGNKNWESSLEQVGAYQVSIDEDAWAFGGTIGVQGKITPDLKFGAFVKSTVSASLEGNAESSLFRVVDSTDAKTTVSSDFELPWIFGLGFIYEISPTLRINVDGLYNLWGSTQSSQDYKYGNSIWKDRLSSVDSLSGYTGSSFPLKYENSFDIGFGLEYDASSDVVVRCGYRYSQTQNTDETYSMLYPSIDQHWISVGVGFWFEELYVDMAVAYGTGVQTEVSEGENPFYAGKYNGDTYIPTINIKYQF